MGHPDPWPLRHLVLRTPRLELRPDDDAGLLELAEEAWLGVHPPEDMPFNVAWTDAPRDQLGTRVLQHFWERRAKFAAASWEVNFLVRVAGRVVGTQQLKAVRFAANREVTTGSWVGLRHQGRGIGAEMRAAVLLFAFDVLGARTARSAATLDNRRSLGVSRKLGYREDGTELHAPRGVRQEHVRLLLDAESFARPDWQLAVTGAEACLPVLTA
jgi:RimJ/RimL family protein N-acetyltransferase